VISLPLAKLVLEVGDHRSLVGRWMKQNDAQTPRKTIKVNYLVKLI